MTALFTAALVAIVITTGTQYIRDEIRDHRAIRRRLGLPR